MVDAAAPRVLVRADERGPAFPVKHPYNPRSEAHFRGLSRLAGMRRLAVNLVELPAGKEAAILHRHHAEEEWAYVLAGAGGARVEEAEHAIGAGDFLGFPTGVAHTVWAGDQGPLTLLVGGEILGVEVGEFPSVGRRFTRAGGAPAVYPVDAEVPFLDEKAREALRALSPPAGAARPARALVRAAERGDAKEMRHELNPRSRVLSTPLSRRAGLKRLAVSLQRVPAGHESWLYHLHHVHEEWAFVLAGRAVVDVGDAEHEVAPGDFVGFPAGGPAHHLRNPYPEDVEFLVGGDAHGGVEVVDYPRLRKRRVWAGGVARDYDDPALG